MSGCLADSSNFPPPSENKATFIGFGQLYAALPSVRRACSFAKGMQLTQNPMYSKLVRDKIPDLIRASGGTPKTRIADVAERKNLLSAKLLEEATEFCETPSLEELADVHEVILNLVHALGYSIDDLETAARNKRQERGGFSMGIVLELGGRMADPKTS